MHESHVPRIFLFNLSKQDRGCCETLKSYWCEVCSVSQPRLLSRVTELYEISFKGKLHTSTDFHNNLNRTKTYINKKNFSKNMKLWEVNPELEKIPPLHNPLFIEGLPGIGNVGKIAVDFLIEEFKAVKIYSFFSPRFPHSVFVNEDNLIEMPKIELYYKKFKDKQNKKDLLLLTGDIQPIDEESCYTFCAEIIKLIQQFNCSEIITLGGIGLPEIPEEPEVYCTGNNPKIYQEYTQKKLGVNKNIFGVVGPIIGVSGILLGLSKKQKIKAVSLLAETFGHPIYLGIKGAKEILRVLETKHNLGLNLQKMNKEIIEVEQEIVAKTKEWASELLAHSQAGAKLKKKEINYIG